MMKKNFILGLLLALFVLLVVACESEQRPIEETVSYEGTSLEGSAPDFTLTDQHGEQVALSDFQGQIVALAFMDSHCEETCPLTAVHLRDAYEALPEETEPVVFLAVNVNVDENEVEDVAAATEKWQLNQIPTWHFLTGSAEELEAVWQAYNVGVATSEDGDDHHIHTSGVYLIDAEGQQRWYISTPYDETGASQGTAQLSELLAMQMQRLQQEG